jgi:hypothetical protein
MKLFILFLIIFDFNLVSAQDNNPFKLISTNEQDTPYLIKVMLEHLQTVNTPTEESIQLLNDMNRINLNFQNMNKLNKLFLVTSESQKAILNFKHSGSAKSNTIMSTELSMVQQKLKSNDLIYSNFSKYIINESTRDFDQFQEKEFLDNYQNNSSKDSKKLLKIAQLKRRIKYSGPWINAILTSHAKSFNEELSLLITTLFRNLAEQSLLFTLHKTNSNGGEAPVMFLGLSDIRIKNYISSSASIVPDLTSSTIQKNAKENAIEDVEKLKITIPANPSQDIDKLIKKIDK